MASIGSLSNNEIASISESDVDSEDDRSCKSDARNDRVGSTNGSGVDEDARSSDEEEDSEEEDSDTSDDKGGFDSDDSIVSRMEEDSLGSLYGEDEVE